MANYANLKSTIDANVNTNGTEAITGSVLNSVLKQMVSTMGEAGYLYKGVATTSTNPGTPDTNVWYLASAAGTYTNFGGAVVADGEVAILKYNGSWTKEVTGAATAAQVTQLGQKLSIPITIDNEVPDYPYASYDQNSMVCDKQQNIPVGAVLKKVKCASSGTAAPKSTKIVVFDANNTRVSRTEIGTIGTTDAEFDISALGIVVQSGYKYCVECVAAKWVSGVSNRYVRITGGSEEAYNDYYFGFAFVAEGSADKLASIEDDIEELQETKPTAAASVNLYDYESRLDGYFFNSNGYTAAAGYALTQPIKVTSGVTYKTEHSAFMGSVRKCARCDESGAYISGLDMTDDNGYDTVTPNFDGYIRFNVGDTNAKSFMVCESSK